MENQEARLGRDDEPDPISHFETATPLKSLLGQEDMNATSEFALTRLREAPVERNVAVEEGMPRCGKRCGLKSSAAPSFDAEHYTRLLAVS
jgi:hypothetical protein